MPKPKPPIRDPKPRPPVTLTFQRGEGPTDIGYRMLKWLDQHMPETEPVVEAEK